MDVIDSERPKSVEIAILVLAAVLVAGLFRIVFGTSLSSVPLDPLLFYGVTFSSSVLSGVVLHKIWSGRNWARVVYALLFCFGLVNALPVITGSLQVPLSTWLWRTASETVQFVGVALLFFPSSNGWFKRVRQ
jgi:hypothetical protein